MSIPEDIVAEVLVKSARHCCVCRNFLPLAIQVHHIREKRDGGTDEIDNLIPVCIQCHASIHVKSHMTRNFSEVELKKTRNIVYDMVSSGKLPAVRSMTTNELEAISASLAETLRQDKKNENLSNDAVEIISAMICEASSAMIRKVENSDIFSLEIGNQSISKRNSFEGQYPSYILELISRGLVTAHGEKLEITKKGQELVSNLVQITETYTQKKIKCLDCGLHFILCTWEKDRHDSSSLHCPECGQNSGLFMVWTQQKFGFIFQDVPGNATLYDLPSMLKNKTKK